VKHGEVIVWLVAAAVLTAQRAAERHAPAAAPNAATGGPSTPWGDPDLQGTWSSEAELGVPFERPRQYGTRQLLTDAEFAARQAQAEQQLQSDNADFDLETADRSNAGQVGSATSPPPHWLERAKVSRRTSLVIDPPDGRLPPLAADASRRGRAGGAGTFGGLGAFGATPSFNGPEDLSLWERCITRGVPGAIFPTVYNANVRIVQSPDAVAITYEMIHDTRVIPLDRRAPVGAAIRGYHGDSRGRWEGTTLVVETANFSGKSNYRGSRETLRLTERFTREAEGIRYEVTVNDPSTWSAPWTAALTLAPQPDGTLFEYACHEGNHAMRNILSAARAAETR
jgi:hypothetical protein